ncbi:hypothetical protein [Sorangium sp. So ce131]|uniref:hypothetical protein n=1 Tax=Sorangium sp. So ce131 TaxID=3133282 RepID=UPI003F5EB649
MGSAPSSPWSPCSARASSVQQIRAAGSNGKSQPCGADNAATVQYTAAGGSSTWAPITSTAIDTCP